ncbi:hypothetical protein LAD77_02140 [Klebsiella pneumoniae]|nr:hypothetical protein [Klebsiella pneumoniae]
MAAPIASKSGKTLRSWFRDHGLPPLTSLRMARLKVLASAKYFWQSGQTVQIRQIANGRGHRAHYHTGNGQQVCLPAQ